MPHKHRETSDLQIARTDEENQPYYYEALAERNDRYNEVAGDGRSHAARRRAEAGDTKRTSSSRVR